jgi:chromosome partitioning protein
METCVSRSAVVDNALNLYKPVLKHRKNSSVAQDYLELAKELIEA